MQSGAGFSSLFTQTLYRIKEHFDSHLFKKFLKLQV